MESDYDQIEDFSQDDLLMFTKWLRFRQEWFQYPETPEMTFSKRLSAFLASIPEHPTSSVYQTIQTTTKWLLQSLSPALTTNTVDSREKESECFPTSQPSGKEKVYD
jgi:hypothetical protein